MNKVLKIMLEVLLILTVLALIIMFLIFTAKSEIVPDIYVTSDSGKVAMAIKGGYKWNSFSESIIADAISPEEYIYKSENTLLVKPNEKMIFKNSENPLNCYKFYQLEMTYRDEDNSVVVVPPVEDSKAYADMKHMEINAPEEEGTYIYHFKLSYYNNGEIEYGLKVVVSTEPNYEIEQLINFKNTSALDSKSINKILEVLPYYNYKSSIILKMNSQERELIINCTEVVMDKNDLKNNVIALFTLIPELNNITYKSNDNSSEVYMFTRSEIENQIGRSLRDYAEDKDLWKKEILFKEKVVDENVSKDLVYKAIIDDIFKKHLEEKANIFIDTEALKKVQVLKISDVDRQEILDYLSNYANVVFDMNYEQYKKTNSKELFIGLSMMRDKLTYIKEQFSGDSLSDTEINLENTKNEIDNYFSGDEYEVLKKQYICSIIVCYGGSIETYNYEIEYKEDKWVVVEI